MRVCQPDRRWSEVLAAIAKGTPPEDKFLLDVYNVKLGKAHHEHIVYALEVYEDPQFRDSTIAFFLSGASLEQIVQGLEIPAEVLTVFEALFIDSKAFRNKLEWRRYVDFYIEYLCASDAGKAEVLRGVSDGPFALLQKWRRGNERLLASSHEMVTEYLIVAFEKAILARNVSILSDASKESYKWGKIAMQALSMRDNLKDTGQDRDDAVAAIQQRKATIQVNELGIQPADIVH